MKPIYLYANGTLKQKDHSLCLVAEEEEIQIPIEQVEEIYCFGEVTLNKRLLQLLNSRKIPILFSIFMEIILAGLFLLSKNKEKY